MVEKKKSVIELLLKIRKAEEQEVKLKEYVKFSENLSRQSEQLEKLVPNLPCKLIFKLVLIYSNNDYALNLTFKICERVNISHV